MPIEYDFFKKFEEEMKNVLGGDNLTDEERQALDRQTEILSNKQRFVDPVSGEENPFAILQRQAERFKGDNKELISVFRNFVPGTFFKIKIKGEDRFEEGWIVAYIQHHLDLGIITLYNLGQGKSWEDLDSIKEDTILRVVNFQIKDLALWNDIQQMSKDVNNLKIYDGIEYLDIVVVKNDLSDFNLTAGEYLVRKFFKNKKGEIQVILMRKENKKGSEEEFFYVPFEFIKKIQGGKI